MSRDIIKLDQIDVTFHQKKRTITAVKDVTIHIQEGDIYGIVGYSGAGKSTLVRVINLLQKPSAGKITIDDDVIFDGKVTLTAEQLRRKRQDIGMIFQHFNLMSQKTAEENVAFALKHSGLSKEEKKAKVAKLLDLVGLADRAENYPSQLSGGQKQRVAIARALANDPKILISDEPLLNELYKHYQVMANILYGNIEILDGTPVGELVVVLSGEKAALAGAQEAIRQAGVQLKVLKGVQ
ncbi:ABC transporter ATP-binding protein [Streptococcus pneumoniae]|nr:ABC transporter ATP-binding protein [Streptococcus pneumoniae]